MKKFIITFFSIAIGIAIYIFINDVVFKDESKSFLEIFITSIISVVLYYIIDKKIREK